MIKYVTHSQIDKARWDHCIRQSVNSLVYGFSWYLDRVSPGWDGLVENDYRSVFPLTCRRKYGIHYLSQPFFTQQLGLFSTGLLSPDLVARFLEAIPKKFKLAEIHLNSMNKVTPGQFNVMSRLNHELELMYTYEDVSKNYSQNTRRNIRKALDAGVDVRKRISADELITLFRSNFGRRERNMRYRDYITIERLIRYSLTQASGILLGAGNRKDHLDAGAFFLQDRNRFILLLGASDFATRDNGAMFLLIDTFIREHAGQPGLLDFEGGNDPDLGRFYKGFGARETTYPFVRISRIPFYKQPKQI
ncbi:MAG: GNAT family N-acetyltransferase [Bacteroidetes bacterium]|nr:MAG: GNAT family N-acetyltransferase [Bacteroidota bacterium]